MEDSEQLDMGMGNRGVPEVAFTLLEYAFNLGVDLQGRNILIQGEITGETQRLVHSFLSEMESLPGEDLPREVTFIINSYGGDLAAMSGIVARMREATLNRGMTIATSVEGEASSAAFIIMAAGCPGFRKISKESSAMLHSFYYGKEGTTSDHSIMIEETKRRSEVWVQWLTKRSKKGVKFWRSVVLGGEDRYFSPEELLKLGLVDVIV